MICVENLAFSVGEFRLREASLKVGDGEYFVLLGPPGSGKSIFLECLCGLNRVESGRVFIDKRDVTDLEPRRRNIGYVYVTDDTLDNPWDSLPSFWDAEIAHIALLNSKGL